MIQVKVRLIGSLRKFKKNKISTDNKIFIKNNTTLNDLKNKLDINTKRKLIFLVDGKQMNSEYVLSDGDNIVILTITAGG